MSDWVFIALMAVIVLGAIVTLMAVCSGINEPQRDEHEDGGF